MHHARRPSPASARAASLSSTLRLLRRDLSVSLSLWTSPGPLQAPVTTASDAAARVASVAVPPTTSLVHSAAIGGDTSKPPAFDSAGRFIMRGFDKFKPMASFLPGVGGLWGVPMWTFYVNRGQGVATFGVKNKENGVLLFQTADKAYQVTPFLIADH